MLPVLVTVTLPAFPATELALKAEMPRATAVMLPVLVTVTLPAFPATELLLKAEMPRATAVMLPIVVMVTAPAPAWRMSQRGGGERAFWPLSTWTSAGLDCDKASKCVAWSVLT